MIRALSLTPAQAAIVERGARAARPLEYCAALLGCIAGDVAVVTDVVRLRNCDTRPGRFAVADVELRRAHLLARERQREIVALAHSHPTSPAEPSERDALAIARSCLPWVIVGFDWRDQVELAAFHAGMGALVPIAAVETHPEEDGPSPASGRGVKFAQLRARLRGGTVL